MNIATRVRLFAPALVLVTASLVGIVIYWAYTDLIASQQSQSLESRAIADSRNLVLALEEIQNDVRFLARLPPVDEFVEAVASGRPAENWKEDTARIFRAMIETKPDYEQLRIIGVVDEGRELVRVERTSGAIVRTAETSLQSKQNRDYFSEALALPAGRLYVSDINLNREHGVLDVPHRPMLRVATPLDSAAGYRVGFLIINMNFERFVQRLMPIERDEVEYYLTNESGDFILHPDPSRRFGFDLGTRYRIQGEFPELPTELVSETPAPKTGAISFADPTSRRLVHIRRLYPFIDEPGRYLLLGVAAPFDALALSSAPVGVPAVAVTLVLVVLTLGMAYVMASRLIDPLKELTAAAKRVAADEHEEMVHLQRDDEIGTLSRSLQHMVTSLLEKETALREANRDLEHFAHIASHDLRGPVRRVAALANLIEVNEERAFSDRGREALQRIRYESSSTMEQLNELRAFARLSQSELVRRTTDLGRLIEELMLAREDEVVRRGVQTSIEPMPTMDIYRGLVALLYGDLIDNALHHACDDGFMLTFTCERRGGETVLGVANTGSELTADADELFEAYRSGLAGDERFGLGLSICRRIVGRHSGRIWAEQGAGRVHFRFTLAPGDQ